MKILYVTPCYPPETAPAAVRASELGRLWVAERHEVSILTGFPNYPTGKIFPGYKSKIWQIWMSEEEQGIQVKRTWLIPLPNRKSWERMLNFCSFFGSAVVRGIFLRKPDVVIATSPQLLTALAGWIIAARFRVPFVFEVRDLWPESLEAVGVGDNRSLLVRLLGRIAGLLYRKASHIVVVTTPFKEHLTKVWGLPPEKISVVPNAVDHQFLAPQLPAREIVQEFGLEGRFVVGHIGNIGNAHRIETLVEAAELLKATDPDVLFLVIGEGAEKEKLQSLTAERQLTNIRIFPAQPRSRIPAIIAATHVCLVLLKKSELFKTVIPTKLLEFMACGRAVIAAVEGEARRIVLQADAGMCAPPEDASAIAGAIRLLRDNAARRSEMESNARRFIVDHFTREGTARDYLSLLEQLEQAGSHGKEVAAAAGASRETH